MTSRNQDLEHLRLLSIFHFVVAGLTALFACLPLIHLFIGIAMVSGWGEFGKQGSPPEFVGWFLILFPGAIILAGWTLAVCLALAGRYLSQRRRYMFCLVTAGAACIFMPFGTVLGIFTIIVLVREPVKQMFEPAGSSPSGA